MSGDTPSPGARWVAAGFYTAADAIAGGAEQKDVDRIRAKCKTLWPIERPRAQKETR